MLTPTLIKVWGYLYINKINLKKIKMKKVVRLTERDLTRLVKRIIKEEQERFTLEEVESGVCGTNGKWEVRNGSLILTNCKIGGAMIDAQIAI
jgi:hypothetical protein